MIESAPLSRLRSSDEETRRTTLQELLLAGETVPDELLDLVKLLSRSDPSSAVRELALRLLKTSHARIRLLKDARPWGERLDADHARTLLASSDPRIRFRVAEAMAQQDDPALAPVAVDFLGREDQGAVVIRLIQVIGALGDTSAIPALLQVLKQGKTSVILAGFDAIKALYLSGVTDHLDTVLAALEVAERDHASPDVRFMARRLSASLASLRGGRVIEADVDDDTLTPGLVEDLLNSPDPNVRMHAVGAVRRRKDPALIGPIARAVGREPSSKILASMVTALRELGSPEHADLVKPLLRHEDVRVCANAVEALVALSGEVVVDALLPLLARNDNRLRANLMIALYSSHQDQVTGFVCRMLRSKQFSNRFSGIYCAQHLDRDDIYPEIRDLLATEDVDEVFQAALLWVEQCARPEVAVTDLEDLAMIRVSRAEQIETMLQRIRPRVKATPEGAPADPVEASGETGAPVGSGTDTARPVRSTRRMPVDEGPAPARRTQRLPVDEGPPPARTTRRLPVDEGPTPGRATLRLDAAEPGRRWFQDFRVTGAMGVAAVVLLVVASVGTAARQARLDARARDTRTPEAAGFAGRGVVVLVHDARAYEADGVITVMFQGQPYPLLLEQDLDVTPRAGMVLELVSPRFRTTEGGSGQLVADEVRVRGGS